MHVEIFTAVTAFQDLRAEWQALPNGRIITIVDASGTYATVDVTGDGVADSDSVLATLGITAGEREQLAHLYSAGQSLWRISVTHFTPMDPNWPAGPPPGAAPPSNPQPQSGSSNNVQDPDCNAGSIIDCQNQGLREEIPINGTPFSLHYESLRMKGNRSAYRMEIQLTGATLPAGKWRKFSR